MKWKPETANLGLKRFCNKKVFTCPRTCNAKTVYNILRFSGVFMPFIEKASSVKLSAKSELTWFLFEDAKRCGFSVHAIMKRFAGDSLFSLFTSFYNEKCWWKLVSFTVLNERVIFTGVNSCQTLFQTVSPGGGGTPLYKLYRYVPPHRVGFARHFGLKTGMVFWGTTRVYGRYLSFQFQMSKKEREIWEFEMVLKNFFVCTLI